jgi:serine/threonine-protein kinase
MGVLLWCCITGQRPFQGPDVPTVLGKVLNEMPPRADRVDPSIPPAIAHATERAMEKRPSARYPTAAAFAQALMEAAEASSIPATAAVSLPPEPRSSRAPDDTGPVPIASASGGLASSVTREIPVAPTATPPAGGTRAGWPRWVLPVVGLVLFFGLGLGVLVVLGVVELERGGADLGGLAGTPLVAPVPTPVPSPPPASVGPAVLGPVPIANGATDTGVCATALACCEALRTTIDPDILSCQGAIDNADGDPAVCRARLLAYQARFGEANVPLPPACTQ